MLSYSESAKTTIRNITQRNQAEEIPKWRTIVIWIKQLFIDGNERNAYRKEKLGRQNHQNMATINLFKSLEKSTKTPY